MDDKAIEFMKQMYAEIQENQRFIKERGLKLSKIVLPEFLLRWIKLRESVERNGEHTRYAYRNGI